MIAGTLEIQMAVGLARLSREVNDAKRIVGSGMQNIERVVGSASRALGALGIGLGGGMFLRQIAKAAMEAEDASLRLEAVLKATGHSAGIAKSELDDMADALARTTTFDDESIRSAQATFLKFGNVQQDIFRKGIALAADYASFTGSAIPEAAQTIGKALQSPTEGVMMLERSIGKLSFTQKENIKTLMEHGDLLEAQAAVLAIVEGRVGGTAAIMNSGLTGATRGVSKAYGELLEAFGKTDAALDPLRGLAALLTDIKLTIEGTSNPLREWLEFLAKIPGFHQWVMPGVLGRMNRGATAEFTLPGDAEALADAARIARDQAKTEADAERAAAEAKRREAAAQAAAKQLAGIRDQALVTLQREIVLTAEATRVEQTLFDIQFGRFRMLDRGTQDMLLDFASQADAVRALAKAEKDAADARRDSDREHEQSMIAHATEIANLRERWLDTIDPLRKYSQQLEEIIRLANTPGGLTPSQAGAATAIINKAALEEWTRLNKTTTDTVTEFWRSAAEGMHGAMRSGFFELMQGDLKDLGSKFKRTMDDIIANILAAQAQTYLFGKSFGLGGANIGGLVGSVIGTIFPAPVVELGTAASAADIARLIGGAAHGGSFGAGNMAWVGEEGPELVRFNQPATVIPHERSMAMAGGDTYYIDARGADPGQLSRLEAMLRGQGAAVRSFRASEGQQLADVWQRAGRAARRNR